MSKQLGKYLRFVLCALAFAAFFSAEQTIAQGTFGGTVAPDIYFASGRPVCDVRATHGSTPGAVGNGITDDSAAFAACVTQLSSSNGGTIYVPPGSYAVKSGISITSGYYSIQCASYLATLITTGGQDVTLVSLNGGRHEIHDCSFNGSNTVGTTNDTISLGSNCVECAVDRIYATFGRYVINAAGADLRLSNLAIGTAIGPAVIYSTGSFSCSACKVDTAYPISTPLAGTNRTAWAATTSYSIGNVVTSGSYTWQAANSGTSGGSAPATQPFGTYIKDNVTGNCPAPSAGVCWLLVGFNPNAAVQLDTGSSTVVLTNRSDLSGPYNYSLYLTGNAQTVDFTNSFMAAYQYGVYDTSSVGGLIAAGNQCNGMISSTAVCFYVRSSDDVISNNTIIGGFIGIETDAGKNYTFANNQIWGASAAGIYLGSNSITNISVIGNVVGSSVNWGTDAIGIDIPGTGSDYITVLGNQCHGATTCVSNASTGTHNLIETTPGVFNATVVGCVYFNGATTLTCTGNLLADSAGDISSAASITASTLQMYGTGSGVTAFRTDNAGSSNFTATVHATNDTVVERNTTDPLTNKTLTSSSNTLGGVTAGFGSDAKGDIYINGGSGNVIQRLGVGSGSNYLGVSGGLPAWSTPTTTVAGASCAAGSTCGLSTATNALTADVNLTNTGFVDGPSMAQGTSGTWWAGGQIITTATAGDTVGCKLWDGTTIIASLTKISAAEDTFSFSGYLASPAGNIRISCENASGARGTIKATDGFQALHTSSVIFGMRIN